MYFTFLEWLGIYCRSDITDYILKDHWYEGKICAKYGGTSFSYGVFTPNPRDLWWVFFVLSKPFRLFFS